MRVLGIDPGYDRLGIAVLDGDRNTHAVIHSECFETDRKKEFIGRLHDGVSRVLAVIDEHSPDIVALETLFFSSNQKTAMHVAEMRGALLFAAQNAGCQVF